MAQFIDAIDLIFREGDSPNFLSLNNDDICVEIAPPGYPGIAQVTVSTTDNSATRTRIKLITCMQYIPTARNYHIGTQWPVKFVILNNIIDAFVTGGIDYTGASQLLTFPPGVNELCSSFVTIIGDDQIELTESFFLSLTPVNTDITAGGNAVVTILDDDRKFFLPPVTIKYYYFVQLAMHMWVSKAQLLCVVNQHSFTFDFLTITLKPTRFLKQYCVGFFWGGGWF